MTSRILVADDSAMIRKMIIKQLSPLEYTVVGKAKNGVEAVEMYTKLKPDLVTLDVAMPEMDGLNAAKEILSFDKSARIVFLYNFPDEELLKQAEEIGVLGLASKHTFNKLLNTL